MPPERAPEPEPERAGPGTPPTSPAAPDAYPTPPPPEWGHCAYPAVPPWPGPPVAVPVSGMAITAFVLSLLVFPAGLVLGILALTRLATPPRRGKGLAVAAVVIASAQILMLAVAVPLGFFIPDHDGEFVSEALSEDRPDENGGPDDPGSGPGSGGTEIDVFDLGVGDCFDSGIGLDSFGDGPGEMTVTRLPCDEPHEAEAYGATRIEGYDAFPGEDEISDVSLGRCDELLQGYILDTWELPYEVSSYYYFPSAETWQYGDREVLCFLGHAEGPELTGSLRGDAGALGPEATRYLEITTPLELCIWGEPPGGTGLSERREWAGEMAGHIEREIQELSDQSWSAEVGALMPDLVRAREDSLRRWRDAADAPGVAAFDAAVEDGYGLLGVDREIAIRSVLGLSTGL
ncbi:septum formation family protein [Streptomyces specialis]|uniref:septum formation family protein n=1 Tax=Streptomyces specialis TaxID=498367 RepID=UPI00073F8F50|nr:septum formation family protein [Streptomyces specialis]